MTKKIKKILIANRGEIACRVIKTARKMGVATVAVYSDVDHKALHVRMADEAVHIGPSPAIESYLVINKIITAAKDTGADAIHPGYGFLSENPDFVRACEKADIKFIGPSAESMEAMGLKDAAKKLMAAAGVPITPGYHGKDQSLETLCAEANKTGYPILIKAVAGGGGKGMRKVEDDSDFAAALASCQREATSSFGNQDVLIEKYIQSPRHIEVQVFGDTHGHVVHMFERDCSLQRRHQKVIEEAPAPGMTEDVRKAMAEAAIEAAKAVNYVGAGTVEFIVDGSSKLRTDGFWFMEMNTRLQVEHPVTEMITGLDLVELQIRVAQGEKLPRQKDIKMNGHAVEARVYAEDPANDFLPTGGKINLLKARGEIRRNDRGFRVDTGYASGDFFPLSYDPMIAKVIGYGQDRTIAINKAVNGLEDIEVYPIKTNMAFLENCLRNPDFGVGKVSTGFIPGNLADLIPFDPSKDLRSYALAALRLESDIYDTLKTPFDGPTGFRLNLPNKNIYLFEKDGDVIEVKILDNLTNSAKVCVQGEDFYFEFPSSETYNAIEDILNDYNAWHFKVKHDFISLRHGANISQLKRYLPSGENLLSSANALTAPMPGKIIAVNAKAGDGVKAGDPLIIMEAMKMEMTLEAPRDGVVAEVTTSPDALVTDGEMLLSLEEEDKK